MRITELRVLDVSAVDMDTLALGLATTKQVIDGYSSVGLPISAWTTEKAEEIRAEMLHRARAEMKRELEVAKKQRSNLRTPDEKRAEYDAKIAQLEKALA